MSKNACVSDEPTVSITGNENAIWGENVAFKAIVTNTDSSCWSLTWQKTRENVTETININRDKYLGSNDRKLVITSVSQEDMWIYQAVLSRNGSEKKQKIFSNDILLKILGGTFFTRLKNQIFKKKSTLSI